MYRCSLQVPASLNEESVTYLSCKPNNLKQRQILEHLSPSDRVDMCKLLNIAVQGVFPLICRKMKGYRSFYEKENIVLVKDYLKEKNNLILPMRIVVRYEDKEIFLGPNLTKIPKRCLLRYHLQSEEFKDSYVITKEIIQPNDRLVECREEIQLFNADELVDILNEDELIEDMDSTLNNTSEINSITTNSSQDSLFEDDFVHDHYTSYDTSLLSETFNGDHLSKNQNEIQVEGSSTQITVNSSEIEIMTTCCEDNADYSNDIEDMSETLVDNSQISNITIDDTENKILL